MSPKFLYLLLFKHCSVDQPITFLLQISVNTSGIIYKSNLKHLHFHFPLMFDDRITCLITLNYGPLRAVLSGGSFVLSLVAIVFVLLVSVPCWTSHFTCPSPLQLLSTCVAPFLPLLCCLRHDGMIINVYLKYRCLFKKYIQSGWNEP